jgi:hypothetical protein
MIHQQATHTLTSLKTIPLFLEKKIIASFLLKSKIEDRRLNEGVNYQSELFAILAIQHHTTKYLDINLQS